MTQILLTSVVHITAGPCVYTDLFVSWHLISTYCWGVPLWLEPAAPGWGSWGSSWWAHSLCASWSAPCGSRLTRICFLFSDPRIPLERLHYWRHVTYKTKRFILREHNLGKKKMACTTLTLRPFVNDSSDMTTTCMDVQCFETKQLCGIIYFTFIKALYTLCFLASTPTITFTILGYIVFRWTFELTAKLNYWAPPFTVDVGNSSLSPQWAALLRCMFYFWLYRMSFISRRTRPTVYGTVAFSNVIAGLKIR